jgi:hypothetical protein
LDTQGLGGNWFMKKSRGTVYTNKAAYVLYL